MSRLVRKWLGPPPLDEHVSLGLAVPFAVAGLVSLAAAVSGVVAEGGTWATAVYGGLAAVWLGAAVGPFGRRWWRGRLGQRRVLDNLCPHCGYDLTGNVSGVCPECGDPWIRNSSQ